MYNAQNLIYHIKQKAKQKNIYIKDMLEACDLNINTLSQISDKKGLSSFSLARIADYLDCSVDYLLGRTDEQANTHYTNNVNGVNFSNLIQGGNSVTVNSNHNTHKDLTKEETEILNVYRLLDARDRTKFMNFIFEMEDKIEKNN